jgi:hypothetical protein
MIHPVTLGAYLMAVCVVLLPGQALAQGDGHLHVQIMDVPEVDGAVLVTLGGQTVLLDNGVLNQDAKDLAVSRGSAPQSSSSTRPGRKRADDCCVSIRSH